MNNIKTSFSIRDLENLSGIKAHTIRIWEKRYNLLQPERTDTNIRTYDLANLQKLLNISYLNSKGYKISRIAEYSEEEITALVKSSSLETEENDHALNSLKLSMINFDQGLFYSTYNKLEESKSFEEIFHQVIMPLLNDIGVLWQTDTITPANEHFITNLIRQKILLNIEKLQGDSDFQKEKMFVLFLPMNEIHELGLMFAQYLLLSMKLQTIYLGPSIPMSSLKDFVGLYNEVTFISYFTIRPQTNKIQSYLEDFKKEILINEHYNLWVLGRKIIDTKLTNVPSNIQIFNSMDGLRKHLVEKTINPQILP